MTQDYPAAHSMDTCWFAVDSAGHVAYFDSGETGHVPAGDENDIRDDLWRLWASPAAEHDDGWDTDFLCKTRGVYYFGYCEPGFTLFDYDPSPPLGSYHREIVPDVPVHVDQLPPHLREMCSQEIFPVRFDQIERFQPLEHARCVFDPEVVPVAYFCADGTTLRPVPGKEAEFVQLVRQIRERAPELARKLSFEGPTE
jgi:hypothetical protein